MKLKWRCRSVLGSLLLLALQAAVGWCQPAVEVVEDAKQGRINWSRGLILAKGIAAPVTPPSSQEPSDRQTDISEARRRARQALFDTAMGVRVDRNRTVLDLAGDSDIVAAKIEEMVITAPMAGQEYLSDGTVAVSLEMSLFGGFSQLVLPPEIKQIESLKAVDAWNRKSGTGREDLPGNLEKAGAEPFTGLVIDARGLGVRPALFPSIVDETGQEVYGSAFVSREFAVQKGMSGYTKDATAAVADPRVAPRPMTVKGLRAQPGNPSVVAISNADGARIRRTPEHLSYLKTGAVIIVLD